MLKTQIREDVAKKSLMCRDADVPCKFAYMDECTVTISL